MSRTVYSPMNGEIMDLSKVSDEMFAQRMLGDGIAIIPDESEKKIVSPVDGVVQVIYETQHAIGISTAEGAELLIHIGIDTVGLKGKPFNPQVKVGDIVKKGDLLTLVNWKYIRKKGCDTVVPVIVMGAAVKIEKDTGEVRAGDPVFEVAG